MFRACSTFKAKLVDLLRDTLSLPLPAGHPTAGAYRLRGVGSVVPGLAWRGTAEEAPGVIRHAFLARIGGVAEEAGVERDRNRSIALGNDWNGWNGSEPLEAGEEPKPNDLEGMEPQAMETQSIVHKSFGSRWEMEAAKAVPSVPSVPQEGSEPKDAIPTASRSLPLTATEWVEAALEAVRLAPHPAHLQEVSAWLAAHPSAPAVGKSQLAQALGRLHQEEQQGKADQLQLGWHLPSAMAGTAAAPAPLLTPVAERTWPTGRSAPGWPGCSTKAQKARHG